MDPEDHLSPATYPVPWVGGLVCGKVCHARRVWIRSGTFRGVWLHHAHGPSQASGLHAPLQGVPEGPAPAGPAPLPRSTACAPPSPQLASRINATETYVLGDRIVAYVVTDGAFALRIPGSTSTVNFTAWVCCAPVPTCDRPPHTRRQMAP